MVQDEKPRPTPLRGTGFISDEDRTGVLRIDKNNAQRIIARYLREKLTPGEANDLANRICVGLQTSMPTPTRPGMRGYRMIPESIPFEIHGKVIQGFEAAGMNVGENQRVAHEAWKVVYRFGHAIPDDVVL